MPKTRESASPKAKRSTITAATAHPTHDEIALRAYQIYLQRGATPGNELEDWTRAERELIAEQSNGHKPRRKPALKSIGAAA